MPRLFSRLPVSLHGPGAKALGALALLCALTAIGFFIAFSETTETVGHLWWKKTREIPYGERRPYLLAGIGLAVAAASLLFGALELRLAHRRGLRDAAVARWRWEVSPEGQAHRQAEAAAAQHRREAEAAERAKRDAAVARQLWERSLAGQAALAYQGGDHYFSIELVVDGDLAQHLNDVVMAGWVQESVGRRHTKTTSARPRYDGTHEVAHETVEYRTYLFRRDQ